MKWGSPILCFLLGGSSLLVTSAPSDPAAELRHVSCCREDFSLGSILRAFPVKKGSPSSLRFTVVTAEEPTGVIGGYDVAWRTYQRQALRASSRETGFAYILETQEGAGAVLWDPVHRKAETQVLRGRDPFAVTPTVTLLSVCRDRIRDGKGVMAWAWVRQPLDEAESHQILMAVRRHLGVRRIDLFLSESPFLWTAHGFPLLVPAFGLMAADAMEKAQPAVIFHCRWDFAADGPSCWRYIE